MKKLLHVIYYIFSGIIVFLATAFCIIEGRLLFSGDWLIYESAFHGCIEYFCRFLMAVFALVIGFLPFVNRAKNNPKISDFLKIGSVALVVMSIIICLFATNYIGEMLVCISVIFLLLCLFKE